MHAAQTSASLVSDVPLPERLVTFERIASGKMNTLDKHN